MPDLTCDCGEIFRGLKVSPLHRWVPEHDRSIGVEVVEFAALAGMHLDVYQQLALHDMYAIAPGGGWAGRTTALIAPRQNLKTFTFEAAGLTDLWLLGDELVVWTAHEFKTTQEAFRDFQQLVDNYDHLRRRVKRVYTGNGEESVELLTGARLNFMARTNRSGRGLTGDKLFLDEGLELTPSMVAASVPATSARPNSQIRVGSSAGKTASGVLRGFRNRGRAGGELRESYTEYAAPSADCTQPDCAHGIDTAGCALDRVDLLEHANTALGTRITLDYIRNTERRILPPREFARERFGWWDDPPAGDGGALDLDLWLTFADPGAQRAVPVYGVDISEDRIVRVGATWRRRDGRVHCALPAPRLTPLLAADKLRGFVAKWGGRIVLGGPATALEEELAGLDVEVMSGSEFSAACGSFDDLFRDDQLRHDNQVELNDSVRDAKWRSVGTAGERAWQLKDAPTIGPLAAVTRALGGLLTAPPPAPAPVGVGVTTATSDLDQVSF